MAVVKEGMIGNTKYKIYDDYIKRTPEEIQETLRRCGEIVSMALARRAAEEAAKEGGEDAS